MCCYVNLLLHILRGFNTQRDSEIGLSIILRENIKKYAKFPVINYKYNIIRYNIRYFHFSAIYLLLVSFQGSLRGLAVE